MASAKDLIAQLDLVKHPEGGWYRETWRGPAGPGERASATAILFLLESGQKSHWHTVDAAEIWLWHAGNTILLSTSDPDQPQVEQVRLGPDIAAGEQVQFVIESGDWQAAEPMAGPHDFALVSCIVSPGFEFDGFKLAPPEWRPDA